MYFIFIRYFTICHDSCFDLPVYKTDTIIAGSEFGTHSVPYQQFGDILIKMFTILS